MLQKDGLVSSMSPQEDWAAQFEGFYDMWPWFGWNIPQFGRYSDITGLSIAIQCASVKARDIAKSPMALWRKKGRSWQRVDQGHWFADMLAYRPNSYHTWGEFWEMVVLHLAMVNNAFILKRIRRDGTVTELLPLMPARCRQRVSDTGRIYYELTATNEFERAMLREDIVIVPEDRIIHIRGKLFDGMQGLSNLELGNPVFELISQINRFQTTLFGNDGKQPLVFEMDQAFASTDVGEAAFQRLKSQLTERARKLRNYGDPLLLEAGIKAKAIASNAKDAMTAEAHSQQVMRVCGIMETPPHKIFHYESVKYDNQAAADNQYANDCLIPLAFNIEQNLALSLFSIEEQRTLWPEFDRQPMLAGDVETLMKVIDMGIKSGVMTINEGRERLPLNLNPVEGGDMRLVPVNFALVDEKGEIKPIAQPMGPNGEKPPGTSGQQQPRSDKPDKPKLGLVS